MKHVLMNCDVSLKGRETGRDKDGVLKEYKDLKEIRTKIIQ